jgi:hypothetical protein
MDLVGLLIAVLIFGLIYWLWTLLPIPQPFKNVALAILIIIAIVWLLGGIPPLRVR